MSLERLQARLKLPDKGSFFPAPQLRFDFSLEVNERGGFRLRGTVLDVGRQDLLGHDEPVGGLGARQQPQHADTIESFIVEAPTVTACIDAVVRKVAQGRICFRSQLVTAGPAGIREGLTRRWLDEDTGTVREPDSGNLRGGA